MIPSEAIQALALRIAERAATWVRPKIPSRQLANAMQTISFPEAGHVALYIPHYWAIYVHDGRGPFGPHRATWLVWFKNPLDDPRLNAGEQVERVSEIKRLTKDQWEYWLEKNRQADKVGAERPMIVVKYVARPTPPTNFFLNSGGMAGFLESISADVAREAADIVREDLGELTKTQTMRVRVRLLALVGVAR